MGVVSIRVPAAVAVILFALSGIASGQATSLYTLEKRIDGLQREVNNLKRDVNILKGSLGQGTRPVVFGVKRPAAAGPAKKAPDQVDKKAAKVEVCKAVGKYVREITSYSRMRDADAMLKKIKVAFGKLAKTLKPYEPHEAIEQVRKLATAIGADTYQGAEKRASIEGNEEFRKAVRDHINALKKMCKGE